MNQTVEHRVEPVDLVAVARSAGSKRLAWSAQSDDLNTNLVLLAPETAVEAHINNEVDVLMVGIDGEGIVEVDGDDHALHAGQVLLITKGRQRAMRAGAAPFSYLTCHRRHAGLWPTVGPR